MRGKKKGKAHSFKHVTKKEKHNSAGVTGYISRTQVIKKLQLSIFQFRQLCILKGIHPVEPGLQRIRKQTKTWYYLKDINFMNRDEIMTWFYKMKAYKKKVSYLKGVNKPTELAALKQNKPTLNMDHFVRERYPTLQDAVNDLDDGLSLISLFSEMQYGVTAKVMSKKLFKECIRLRSEWLAFVTETHALRKVFVSIKGTYYQAEILGNPVTWLVPHPQRVKVPVSIDVMTMSFFVQFYTTALNFVFYRLYTDNGYQYPPTIDSALLAEGNTVRAVKVEKIAALVPTLKNETPAVPSAQPAPLTAAEKERIAIVNKKLAHIISVDALEAQKEEQVEVKQEPNDEESGEVVPKEFKEIDEREGENKEQYVQKSRLFQGFKFFINREMPKAELRFMIRAFGGEDFTELDCEESDPKITHQIVDRDCSHMRLKKNREYIQPQWIFDSINAGILLPYHEYAHNATLPPHISPFINDALKGYVPAQREHMNELIAQSKQEGEEKEEETKVVGREVKDEEEGEMKYIGEQDEEDAELIEAQYARELAAEQEGRSYAGYVQDEKGETEMFPDDETDDDLEAALKKKPLTKKEKMAEAKKKDDEERESMAIDLLTKRTKRKVLSIKNRLIRNKAVNDTLMDKRIAIEKQKKKEAKAAMKALPEEPQPVEKNGKRKEDGSTGGNKSAKKPKK
jgi:pescadillo protein